MNNEIQELQQIVDNESLPAEQRKAAAEHILKLQGEPQPEQVTGRPYRDNDPRIAASLKRVLGEHYYNGLGKHKQ